MKEFQNSKHLEEKSSVCLVTVLLKDEELG